jgi:CheY-like chemotaxis protein
LNILSNALKFTITGKIEVTAVSVSDTHAGISVRDTGVGIPEGSIGKIFQLFGKLEGNEKLNPQGCGLGLSISSMLVKSLGGTGIHVESKRFVGSLFVFEVKITRNDETTQPPDSLLQPDSPEFAEGVSKIVIPGAISVKSKLVFPEILIADDVDYNRIVLRKILESVGYDCDEAPTGVQVIQLVKSRANMGKPYLVILMDVEMPEMDGIAATRELLAMVGRGELAVFSVVIGCSAYSAVEDRNACFQAGMQYYLEKPVVREVLFNLLTTLVPNLEVRGAFH